MSVNEAGTNNYELSAVMIARHIIFRGNVQGVGFRFTAVRIAQRHGVAGWVRNLPDGTVEMFAQGQSEDVEDCLRDIQEAFRGYIVRTDSEQAPVEPDRTDFRITY